MQQLQETTKLVRRQSRASICAEAVIDAVPPVVWFIRRQMRAHRKDLSLPQFRVLVCLQQEPKASLSTVADFLGASLPTASRIVSGLVKNGLLERSGCDNDRRQLSLQLTATGLALMERSRAGTHEKVREQLQSLDPDQRQTVTDAMHLLRKIFGSTGFSLGRPLSEKVVPGNH